MRKKRSNEDARRRTSLCGTVIMSLCATLLGACESSPDDPGRAPNAAVVREVVDLGVVEQDELLIGRDGGYSGSVGDRDVWVFGDTVLAVPDAEAPIWLSNSWSSTIDRRADDGLEPLTLGRDAFGEPSELLPYTEAEEDFNERHRGEDCAEAPCGARWALWPGPLVSDDARGRSLLFYSKIYSEPGPFNFRGVGSSIAVWSDARTRPSRRILDEDAAHPTLLFGEDKPAFGAAALIVDDHLHAFACEREESIKPCLLARVPLDDALDEDAWEYLDGERRWTSDGGRAAPLFHGSDIMSVAYNAYLQRFVAVYAEPLGRDIVLRTATRLAGPWSAPVHVARALETREPGWVYDALAHAELESAEGRTLYVSYTREPPGRSGRELRLLRVEIDLAPRLSERTSP